ncbi:MAG: hypothetical protein PHV17_05325 [Candidatus Omnitrophica bacterium]|nr:hypothetical protein [Candidatus Omnitrophota bacterium]
MKSKTISKKYELLIVFSVFLIFVISLKSLLISNQRMVGHDSLWYYGSIHYFFNSLSQGVFPYWDAYDYCGQPFFYNVGISRVFEFPSLLLICINSFLKGSFLSLYHWDIVFRLMIISFGVYKCFQQTNKYALSSYIILISFLFSSFSYVSMWQPGVLTSFIWTPYALWFLLRLTKRISFYNMVGFSLFCGFSVTSYQAGYTLTFISCFILSFFINRRAWLLNLFSSKVNRTIVFLGLLIVLALSLQAFALFLERDQVVPLLRQMENRTAVSGFSAQDTRGGHSIKLATFTGLFVPKVSSEYWRKLSFFNEVPLYIGILPIFLVLLGLVSAKNSFKINFIIILGAVIFLMTGGIRFLGRFGDILFPFLKYAQHMQLFGPFFIFVLMYFLGQGCDSLIDRYKNAD